MKKIIILSSYFLLGISSLKGQTPDSGTVTDIDGNAYHTVVIGNFEWMAENLKTTSWNNNTKIPNIIDSIAWIGLTIGAYCWYNNDESNAKTYGALYNWYAVNTGRLCPEGWRVPSDEEWKLLEGYVDTQYGRCDTIWDDSGGRGNDAGQRLKKSSGWSSGGIGKDDFGFSALPGGERCSNGRFFLEGRSGFWWSSTGYDESGAWYRNMIYSLDDIFRLIHPKWMGFSVRCLRDKQRHTD
ncbi:MAG: hypothetical protein M0Q38_13030 [Bacteroidales bacterium]|nr:hypothetical protein [Bacteroidales bacterium]